MATSELSASGEVTEREDLLDGRVRVALEGAAGPWQFDAVIGWRRGRTEAIEVEPQDSYLTLSNDEDELNASVVRGAVSVDPDTGLAQIEATLALESNDDEATRGAIEIALSVDLDGWSGAVRLDLE